VFRLDINPKPNPDIMPPFSHYLRVTKQLFRASSIPYPFKSFFLNHNKRTLWSFERNIKITEEINKLAKKSKPSQRGHQNFSSFLLILSLLLVMMQDNKFYNVKK